MGYPDKPNESTRVFTRGRQEGQKLRKIGRLLALKMEKGARI